MEGFDSGRKLGAYLGKTLVSWYWMRVLWCGAVILSAGYIIFVYLFPLIGLGSGAIVPGRMIIELTLGMLPILASLVLLYSQMDTIKPVFDTDDEFVVLSLDHTHVGIVCLRITTVSNSILSHDDDIKYNSAPLLALRAGMIEKTNYAFQYGVQRGEPFLNLFISSVSKDVNKLKETLRREATRTEAIFLSSLEDVTIEILRDDELKKVLSNSVGLSFDDNGKPYGIKEEYTYLQLKGTPKVAPTETSSQVGTFISTSLRQGYSISLTCVFSKAKASKESRQLESKWKSIKAKERRNEESLADQAMKRTLLDKYQEISENTAWFDSTIYLTFDKKTPIEGVKGLVHSVWNIDDNLELEELKPSRWQMYRLLIKRHLKKQKLHVNRLVAFINTPTQRLPVVSSISSPEFQIPANEMIENELQIGWAVYGNRRLGSVGLKQDWLREHMAVLGATGTGKTTLVKKLMSEISVRSEVPWWIFDVKGSEYSDLAKFKGVNVIRPGLDPTFVIDLIESASNDTNRSYSTFSILRELIKENSTSELSPAMEKLLRESIQAITEENEDGEGVESLVQKIKEISSNDRLGHMTRDALLNRLEILTREPLGSILAGGNESFRISEMLDSRIVFDLRYISQVGGMDAARLLYNLVAKRIFNASMKRGISSGLHHLVVLEEASNLVPESYTRHSAADVSTGESMVMLQRATGQGVIVVSTRPNISSNILANTSTKITFRLPFDSAIGGRFMSIEEDQEQYLRTLKRGRALILIPNCNTFEIETDPYKMSSYEEYHRMHSKSIDYPIAEGTSTLQHESISDEIEEQDSVVFDRIGELANHIVAFLASKEITTHADIRKFLTSLDTRITDEDVNELLRDLVSLSTIQREAIPLVPGGFIYSSPGKGLSAVRLVILNYLIDRLDSIDQQNDEDAPGPDLLVNETAIIVIPEHLKASSFDSVIERIRYQMNLLRNSVVNLIVIVRGSVAAAKLREFLDGSEEFDAVSVVSAFPSSLSRLVESLVKYKPKVETLGLSSGDPEAAQVSLLEAVHEIGSASSRAVQLRLWFGLLQDFIDLSQGCVSWDSILEFIDTTALQSRKGRSAPLNIEEGKRALTELLADEVLVAMRIGSEDGLTDLNEGLWIINANILETLKTKAIEELKNELEKRYGSVALGHGYYDICANGKSYVVFPTQQELSTLIRLHSEIACRTCESKEVICILTAAEYLEDSIVTPSNLVMRTMDEGLASIFI